MAVNVFIQNEDGSSKLAGADYYLFFAATMFVFSLIFIAVARWYERTEPIVKAKFGGGAEAMAIENA